jgi:4-hydroxybenzoate polyprenyltransferase
MFLKIAQRVFNFFILSSFNVVLATGVCFVAFSKLPNNQRFSDYVSLVQLCLVCWVVYILDRLQDNILTDNISTPRHRFHFDNQFMLQILMIAAVVISVVLTFFQSKEIIIYGGLMSLLVLGYLFFVIKKWPFLKEFLMPAIYTAAVVGIPFVSTSSIGLSSWILGFMFLLLTLQNAFAFSYFEALEGNNSPNISNKMGEQKTRKVVNWLTSVQILIVVVFFSSQTNYPNLLSFVLLAISVSTSLIMANAPKFTKSYRWIVDGLLFLPLVVF